MPDEVMELTRQYIHDIWLPANTVMLNTDAVPGVPFTRDELIQELCRIPVTKSVAKHCLPGICWKTHATAVTDFIFPKLERWWNSSPPFIPDQWKAAHLTFIHKPGKTPDNLLNLRPLALLEPVGKSILGLLTSKFALEVRPLITDWPQFAFMPNRSSLDAIRRVVQHCLRIRHLHQNQRRSVHQRAAAVKSTPICGGIQVLLDATRAFDRVPRQPLFDFIHTLPVDQRLVVLLTAWHSHTAYVIEHDGQAATVGTDITWTTDWTHVPHLQQLVHAARHEQLQVSLATPAHEALTVQRPTALNPGAMSTMQDKPTYPLLTDSNLSLLLSKPYGLPILECIKARRWGTLLQYPDAVQDLTSYCVICGVFSNRPQELNQHLRTQHHQLVPHVMTKASQLCKSLASNSPCRFCQRSFKRVHQCPVMTQAAVLLVNTDCTGDTYAAPGQAVLHCDICHMQFQELRLLNEHLDQLHRLDPQDWDPLRDLLGSDPVCSHCLACFADRSAVRQHITLGQCLSFDPMRPAADLPVPPDWQEIIMQGQTTELRQAPMKRLQLTLRCQLCQTQFQRTGDLSLHLQTTHASLWAESQMYVPLLIASCLPQGCLCNPMTNASGLQHVCVPLRQLGMMAAKMAIPLYLPWKFAMQDVTQYLHAVADQSFKVHTQTG
ncbi:unnamed protein product [Cladocopium goreaui]|uniref:C2H2-type domain-containing protein n=1 Tax=Cladocopium goreaui TaxID=2562237 RepID=A0A9P1D3F6_9DINO|nr:unnamed protein product [Cladocopium goreaui]